MGLLDGKRLLITGVLTDASLAFAVARLAQEEGAEIVLSGAGRALSLTQADRPQAAPRARGARDRRHLARAAGRRRGGAGRALGPPRRAPARHRLRARRLPGQRHVRRRLGRRLGGAQHLRLLAQGSGRRVPAAAVRRRRATGARRSSASTSTPRWPGRSTTGWAWPRRLSSPSPATWPRSSAPTASGSTSWRRARCAPWRPSRSRASRAFEDTWADRAPLGWDVHDSAAVAKACMALFSDLFPMTTGEIVHVDGGVHAVGGSA